MKKFIWGIILDENEYLSVEPDEGYYELACGDYMVHGMFDITNPEKPQTIYLDDNTHTDVESLINGFFQGLDHCRIPYQLTSECVFVTSKGSSYDSTFADLREVIKGSTTVYNINDVELIER